MSMQIPTINSHLLLSSLVILTALGGCATTTTPKKVSQEEINKNDPWEGWNRGAYAFNDTIDKAILKPLAKGYDWITPEPVDQGVTNFFSNMNDIGVTINDFLQFKLAQGGMDASRFLINTTVGVVGIFDVAKMIDLPKHNEDFGQTLGYWGVPSGNYLVLPFFGSSSPRETAGLVGDALFNPLTYTFVASGAAAVSAAATGAKAVDVTDTRSDLMTTEKIVDEASVDRYSFIKSAYQQRRKHLVNDGNVSEEDELKLDEDLDIEGGEVSNDKTTKSSSAPVNKTPVHVNSDASYSTPAPANKKPAHVLKLLVPDKK
ncbi:MAG: VacJ family lipoprotein [Methylobacter sp.]|nr:VacJ family lipoprotein [Methylobacter sp.]